MSENTHAAHNSGAPSHEAIAHEDINVPNLKDPNHGDAGVPIQISKYTKALIKSWSTGLPKKIGSPDKISVSQTVSFLAFLYEKMRNAVEFREEHLIRKAAIERIIKRRMVLNENGRNIAELLIKELLWARYYENNTIDSGKVAEIQSIIDKYLFLRNEIASGRGRKEHDKIADFILDALSCEIEENLSPDPKNEAFINYVYQLIRPQIAPFNGNKEVRDIQVYIAVLKSFGHYDLTTIRYNLLKLMLPDITKITWQSSDKVLPGFYEVYTEIEKNLNHPSAEKTRNIVKKLTPPFFILKDIFKTNPKKIEEILTHEGTLKSRVDETCRKRYEETKSRLRRTGVRSFIYILLTKVVFALILEIPYDLYIIKSISYIPIFTNIIFPPALMTVIILSVTVPGDENTRKIFNFIKDLIATDPSEPDAFPSPIVVERKVGKGMLFTTFFPFIYLFTYLLSFGTIIYILSYFHFNPVSQGIFIFFVTLVTFFAYRVVDITREYLVVDREGPLTSLVDFFFLPIIRVGQWLSGEVLTRFNLLIFVFDFIIEMPLKAIVEIVDEWIHFVRIKKEEMI